MNYLKKDMLVGLLLVSILTGCTVGSTDNTKESTTSQETEEKTGSLELQYATQFSVDYYGDYAYIEIADGNSYVLVPEGASETNLGFSDATVISQEQLKQSIYLAASSAMDLFLQLDALDSISTCSTTAEDYAMEEVQSAIEKGDITYVGKYSAPDYETLLATNCGLAIESTMIYHAPKIKEELENLGILVLVERSSYEEEPLGRLEWIKLYGVLLGEEDTAEAFFQEQCAKMDDLTASLETEDTEGKTVAVFYISSNGYVNVRKPGDYITKMLEIAGGTYALQDLELDEENALSTVNINWEDFYKEAVNADILIYNGTIDGGVTDLDDLLSKNALFADFQAVQTGNVYCTNLNLFQESSKIADIIVEFHEIISGSKDDLEYLYPLE